MNSQILSIGATPVGDRRQGERFVSVLRVCCIETSQGIGFAMLRNISANGAQIEADIDDPVGSPICYFFDDSVRIEAEIAWKKDGRVGLANRKEEPSATQNFPRRALRVPLSEKGRIWVNGKQSEINVANISQTGALLLGSFDFPNGTLLSLELGSLVLENVTVKWTSNNSTGVKFDRPLHMRDLKLIVEERRQRLEAEGTQEEHTQVAAGQHYPTYLRRA